MSEIQKIFCSECGAQIDVDLNEVSVDTVFCTNCGNKNDISFLRQNNTDSVNDNEKPAENTADENVPEDTRKSPPFEPVSDEDEAKAAENKISGRVRVWHEAIKTSSDDRSEFTDNFAHGMPGWDLTPPDTLIRRKAARPAGDGR